MTDTLLTWNPRRFPPARAKLNMPVDISCKMFVPVFDIRQSKQSSLVTALWR